ncbi:MAG: CIA30 family protein [Woeseiaceae bacterium]
MNVKTYIRLSQALVIGLWLCQPLSVSGSALTCTSIFDAADVQDLSNWRVVGDTENLALSLSEIELTEGSLSFRGRLTEIEDAFSAVNIAIDSEVMTDADRLVLEFLPDARSYDVTMATGLFYRNRRLTYHTALADLDAGNWVNKTVMLSELRPVVNGHPVRAPAYEPAKTRSMYIIIHDGEPEPFELQIRSIQACHTLVE